MKSTVFTMENGQELRIDSNGDELTLSIPGGRMTVMELAHGTDLGPGEEGVLMVLDTSAFIVVD